MGRSGPAGGIRRLSPLEQAAGLPLGPGEPGGISVLPAETWPDPLQALQATVLPLVARQPCLVSFSGGRDSSAVLAIAVAAARAAGYPDPVPVTLRFPGVESTEESDWQELVVRHLGVKNWERVDITTELDFLGPLARTALSRHGLLWPANAHFLIPVLRIASGAAVLTGLDGDGLFGAWRWARARALLRARIRPRPRDAARVGLMLAPAAVRRAWLGRAALPGVTWLRPVAAASARAVLATEAAGEPRSWDRRVQWYAERRHLQLCQSALALLGEDYGTHVAHPLLDAGFLAALARAGGTVGYGSRTAVMRALFAGMLPDRLLSRPIKAEFGRGLWGPEARAFAAGWGGQGIDPDLLDVDSFRMASAVANPPIAAATVIQAAWVAGQVK